MLIIVCMNWGTISLKSGGMTAPVAELAPAVSFRHMINEWISGLQLLILLSFLPGAEGEREFPVTVSAMCEAEVGGQPGIALRTLLLSFSRRLWTHAQQRIDCPLSNDNQTGLKLKSGRQREEVGRDKSHPL